jgi:Family of unknown function (DUF5686)/CarboxypepD_reg-like domain
MILKFLLLPVSLFILSGICISQTYEVSGTISDARTNKALEYVTVKVADTSLGTTADKDGKYFIRLKPGGNKLIFSFIGYNTDTSSIYIENKNIERNIFLKPSEILTEEIEVYGEDPAYEIIRKAIKYKKQFKAKLNEYEYDAYSKFVIRSNTSEIPKKEIAKDSVGNNKLGIFGILESQTKGYFKKPDLEKQIVISKKETANITRGFALPLIVNFYDENIDFGEFKIPTPLSDNAFDNYEYKLIGTTSIDSTLIFKIRVINTTENRPLLNGVIYIADSIFSLMRVDLNTNEAAKPLAIDKVNFKQKFSSFIDKKDKKDKEDKKSKDNLYWMPTDVEIFANGSFAGLIKFEAEVFTIVSNYLLNKKAPKGTFDEFVVKVMPDAKKDSAYWAKNQLIKNTYEERKAYKQIEVEDKKKSRELNIGLGTITYGKHFTSHPFDYYHFNRVEGSAAEFNLSYRQGLRRISADGYFGYGFSDKKSKYEINFTQRFFNDRRLVLNASAYKNLQPLSYPDFLGISEFYNTLTSLFDKLDNLDYFYSNGYYLGLRYNFFPQLAIGLSFRQDKQTTANTNTNYSFRKRDEPFKPNPEINDAFQRVAGVELRINPNLFRGIDWGNGDISRFEITDYPELRLGFKYSGKDLFNSTYEYRKFLAIINGNNYVSSLLNFSYLFGYEAGNGQIPFQSLSYFQANTGTIDNLLSFTALNYQEFLGDRLFYFKFENDFGKLFWARIPVINNFNLIGFVNMGRSFINDANYQLASYKSFSSTHGVYAEAGFGISRILDIFRIDFAWRLNNLGPNGGGTYVNFIINTF